MTGALMIVFAIGLAVPAYVYFGYPALIWVVARMRPRPVKRDTITPRVTLLVALYNEERVIEEKIRNTLAIDYPDESFEALFVSDGCSDRTEEIVRMHEGPRVRLLSLPRGGKAAALNAGAAAATGEILVFTDANVALAPDSVRVLASAFADPAVGGNSGRKTWVVRTGSDTTELGENLYWRYDQWQKELESAIGSIFAADGTLYAVRRSLYVPIADPAQADDIAISARVVLQGFRLLFDRNAVAYEEAPAEGADEFRRKVRVTNHSVRALLNLGRPLFTSGFYSVELISHKLLRHLVPFFLIPLFLASAALAAGSAVFGTALALQVVFYGLALAGAALRRRRAGAVKVFSVPYYFCLVNAAAFVGVLSIARGRRVHAWTPRSS
jgi:cellulose synthase/poly-beta-1,6-N-acetylglucosamine synthase-like glycosyltransferase